jgi:F-type H+-transporting ATPase subunit b
VRKTALAFAAGGALLFGTLAWAATDAHHGGPVEIPWKSIFVQAGNFGGLLLILGYILRKTVRAHFSERRKIYMDLVSRADAAKQEAEKNRADIAARLSQLESTSKQSLQQANAEAAELRQRIVAEAKELAAKLKEETERSVRVELEKARAQMREELLAGAVEAARKALKEKVSGAEQMKLQKEFVDKIQVVQ